MTPTNVALVKLLKADQALRGAQGRLESASQSVRFIERRLADLNEKLRLAQATLREQQAKTGELDLDVKTREGRIDRLRQQQQSAKNHKEYQAFLTEINTEKIDKNKVEDELLKAMESVETHQAEIADLSAQVAGEQKKYDQTQQQLSSRLAELGAEVEKLRPARDEAAKDVPPRALDMFERLAERYEGEPMAAISKPDRRSEEYVCTACNMSLVADMYNRLHTSSDPVICPNCRRLLYVPEELTPDVAVRARSRSRRERESRVPSGPATVGRQTSAADISRSISAGTVQAEAEHQSASEPEHQPVPPAPEPNQQP